MLAIVKKLKSFCCPFCRRRHLLIKVHFPASVVAVVVAVVGTVGHLHPKKRFESTNLQSADLK